MVNRYARHKETPEEIQGKMKALYPKYQQLQRDGSVSMSANEAQDLLSIHKHLFNGQNFCTTCQPAILQAIEVCFRNYDSQIKEFDRLLCQTIKEHNIQPSLLEGLTKRYVFSGTNKQWKQVKQAWPDFKKNDILQQGDRILTLVIANSWISWFKEV